MYWHVNVFHLQINKCSCSANINELTFNDPYKEKEKRYRCRVKKLGGGGSSSLKCGSYIM